MGDEQSVIVETMQEQLVVVGPIDERANVDIEIAVNRGIAAAALGGLPEGLKVMEAAGVPRNITIRVLQSKERRRASDWK